MSGPRLVKVEPWHFHFFLDREEAENLSGRALGRTLISSEGTPLGFGGVYFDENAKGEAVAIVFFYGGPNQYFAQKYLVMVIRGITESAKILKDMGFKTLYAVADKKIPASVKFIEWAGGERVEEECDAHGPIYAISMDKIKFLNR